MVVLCVMVLLLYSLLHVVFDAKSPAQGRMVLLKVVLIPWLSDLNLNKAHEQHHTCTIVCC